MGTRNRMHQALRMLNEHKVATGSAAMALLALLLILLPRIILTFVLGMIASPILIVVTAVYFLQSINQLEKARPETAPKRLPLQGRSASEGQTMEHIMDTVVQGLAKAPAGDYPPYPVWGGNEYQGWLWTMENDKFDRSNTLDNWPPKVPGACKWWAHLQGSTLIIARDRALPEDSSHSGKAAAGSQAHAQELEDALVVREIDLQGCRLLVLTEALQGKSRWLRKAPLELSHPDHALFEGQQTVLLFAAGSAAKEQWFVALSAATSADGGPGSSVHALYNTFCDYVREHALVDYPEAEDQDMQQDGLGGKGKGKSRGGQGRWLSRWLVRDGSSRKQGRERAGSKKPEAHAPPHHLETKSAEPRKAPAAVQGPVLNPTERMDMLWMGKQLPPTPKLLRDAGGRDPKLSRAGPNPPSVHAATPTGRVPLSEDGAFRQNSAAEEHGTELQDLASPSQPKSAVKRSLLPLSAQSLPAMRLASNEDSHGNEEDDEDRGPESDEDGSSEDESQATSPRSPFAHPQGSSQAEPGSRRAGQKGRKRKQRASAAAHLPNVPVEAAVNMLLARAGFDLLRSAAFKQRLHAHIQKKLDVLRVPEYIQSIEVIDVELGSMVPGISNLRALPCPTEALWPQTVFDLDYGGGLTVIIEAKLDVRDSASWDTLDKAIGRLGGASAVSAAAAVNGSAAVVAAAAADVVSAGESDEDEGTGGAAADNEVHKQKKVGQLQRLRNFAAKRMRNLAEITAEHISKMHLRIQVDIHSLQGTVCAWVPPPPNDRLWFGFITAPELKAEVTPIVANDVRGRAIMMSYQASSVPKWVADKLQSAITKNLTLPSCADIPLPYLLPVDHPDAGAALPGFLRSLQGDVSEGHSTTPDGKRAGRDKRQKRPTTRADSAASSSIPEAEVPRTSGPAHKEEGKQHRGFLRWTRRGRRSSEPSKASMDMEPVIQTEKDARRLSSAKRSVAHEPPAASSSKDIHNLPQARPEGAQQSPDVELSTFVTAAEHAREGKELQSLNSAHCASEESDRRQASGLLAEQGLVLSDHYGQATISTTLREDGRIEAHSESTAAADGSAATVAASVASDSPGSAHSQEGMSAPAEAAPAPPVAAAAASFSQPLEALASLETRHMLGNAEAEVPLSPVSSPPASTGQGSSETSEGRARSIAEQGSGSAEDREEPEAAASVEGHSPSAAEEAPEDFAEGKGRQDAGAEGSSRHAQGAWKDIGGAMGKKYLEAFKNQKSITYSQGKKMATSLAGQAQEQMRKALAAREKASKTDKRA